MLRDFFFTCFASFYYLVICSILFHYIHAFLWISCAPLIILDHHYVSRVKLSSFLYPLCFILLGGVLTSFFLYTSLVTIFTYIVLIFDIYLYVDVGLLHLPLHMLFLFSFYTHVSYILYAIFFFFFTQRCLNEFCLKCFKNTGYQSLLAINSLLAKIFKSLCYDRFYCIQQVNMSWVIYNFSHISFVCRGFVTDCQRGRLLGNMWFNVRNIYQHFYEIGLSFDKTHFTCIWVDVGYV